MKQQEAQSLFGSSEELISGWLICTEEYRVLGERGLQQGLVLLPQLPPLRFAACFFFFFTCRKVELEAVPWMATLDSMESSENIIWVGKKLVKILWNCCHSSC